MAEAINRMIDYISKAVPKFSGKPSNKRADELKKYLETSQMFYDTLEGDNKITYMKFLIILSLTDEASNLAQSQTIDTFEKLKTILTDNYLPAKSLLSLSDELRSCTQGEGENLSDYGRRVIDKRSLCRAGIEKLYPAETEGFKKEYDTIALKAFKQGLSNSILRQHAFLQDGTLEELIAKLGAIDELPYNGSNNNVVNVKGNKVNRQNRSHERRAKTEKCRFCQKWGHDINVCRAKISWDQMQMGQYDN